MLGMLLVLNLVVFVHELGHYLVYRWRGVSIRQFSVGFGPVLLRKRIGDTDFCLSAIPLGGYVLPMDKELAKFDSKEEEEKFRAERPGLMDERSWMSNSGAFTRFIGAFAGPAFNYIFALFAGTLMFLSLDAVPVTGAPSVRAVTAGSFAEQAGVEAGDVLVEVNGDNVDSLEEAMYLLKKAVQQDEITVTVKGSDGIETFSTALSGDLESRLFGVQLGYTEVIENPGILVSLRESWRTAWDFTVTQAEWFQRLFIGKSDVKDVSSVVGIVSQGSEVVVGGWIPILSLLLIINVALGFMNLLPIPPLDGSHMLMAVLHGIRGRPLGERAERMWRGAGMVFLLSLMLLGLVNDLFRIFGA